MKSIIEEAPSILKAIEKAWIRAGNPVEFSVKIFEDAQKNFFGFSSKNAKVGVFFEIESIKMDAGRQSSQNPPTHTQHAPKPQKEEFKSRGQQPSVSNQRLTSKPATQPTSKQVPTPKTFSKTVGAGALEPAFNELVENLFEKSEQPISEVGETSEIGQQPAVLKVRRVAWNDDMLAAVSMWLKDLLAISNLGNHQPTLTVLDNRLVILFATPLYDDPAKASDLYRSLSYLLIGMVRSKFKKEFRFLKIVLTDGIRDREHNES